VLDKVALSMSFKMEMNIDTPESVLHIENPASTQNSHPGQIPYQLIKPILDKLADI